MRESLLRRAHIEKKMLCLFLPNLFVANTFFKNNWFTSLDEESVARTCMQIINLVFFFMISGLFAVSVSEPGLPEIE